MSFPLSKYYLFLLLLPFLKITGLWAQEPDSIATYNVRLDTPSDSGYLWEDRVSQLINLIRIHEMDIIGRNGGLYTQVEDLNKDLDFPYIGEGRESGESCAVFYNPEKFQLLDTGAFWLAPTPEKPVNGGDIARNRTCSWGKFKTSNDELFYVFNVHYHPIDPSALEESKKRLHKKITEINKEHLPCILTGDFNGEEYKPAYQNSIEDTIQNDEDQSYSPPNSSTKRISFPLRRAFYPEKSIGTVFFNADFSVEQLVSRGFNCGEKSPSTHSPLLAHLK